jgi:hypothetical protein
MSKDFLIAGTKRSGHHAVITWLASQMPETVRHYNDILYEPFSHGEVVCKSRPGDTYIGNVEKRNIYSMEDVPLSNLTNLHKSNLTIVVVIRDIRNTLASDIKACNPKVVNKHLKKLVGIWRGYVEGYLGSSPEYFILFDRWFKDKSYRRKICYDLNVPFTDKGLNKVPNYGGGSSFDLTKFNGKAQHMDVLNRWVRFKDHSLYKKYYSPEIRKLNELIYK